MLKRYMVHFRFGKKKGEGISRMFKGEKLFYDRKNKSWIITEPGGINKVTIPQDAIIYIAESEYLPFPEEPKT